MKFKITECTKNQEIDYNQLYYYKDIDTPYEFIVKVLENYILPCEQKYLVIRLFYKDSRKDNWNTIADCGVYNNIDIKKLNLQPITNITIEV